MLEIPACKLLKILYETQVSPGCGGKVLFYTPLCYCYGIGVDSDQNKTATTAATRMLVTSVITVPIKKPRK